MADAVALVEQMYSDFAAGDVAAVLARLARDVEWSEAEGNPWWSGRPFVGVDEIVDGVLRRIAEDFDGFAITVNRIVGLGGTVLMQGRYTGTARATGLPLDLQAAHVWDVRGDEVVRFQQYVDTSRLRAVLAVAPEG